MMVNIWSLHWRGVRVILLVGTQIFSTFTNIKGCALSKLMSFTVSLDEPGHNEGIVVLFAVSGHKIMHTALSVQRRTKGTLQGFRDLEVDPHRYRSDVCVGLIGAVHRRIRIAGDRARFEQKSLVRHINSEDFPAEEACL